MWVIKPRDYRKPGALDAVSAFEVGYYVPAAAITPKWVAIKDCSNLDEAMDLAHYLNGGNK